MKKNLILIFCVLLGLAWFTAISDAINNPKKAQEHLAKARELESQGIYVDAITEYEEALEYWPQDVEISLEMANAYLHTGSSKKFVNICKNTAEENQKDTKALDTLIHYYLENHDEASAVKYLGEFAEKYPKNEYARGWLMELRGSYEELFCNYEELGSIWNNSMIVRKKEAFGLADGMGGELLPSEYEEVHPYSEDGLALVRKEGTYLYVDRNGQTRLVPDASYTDLGMISSERTRAAVNGKYGYLDEKLEPVTEFVWDDLTLISDGMGAAQLDGAWALVDKNGKAKTEYQYEDVIMDEQGFCCHQKRMFVKEQGAYHLVDKKGKPVGELSFEEARCFSEEGYAAVRMNGTWGFINADGELALECQYEDAQSFRNGFAAVCVEGIWGYVDESGRMVVKPEFEEATPFSDQGTAAVKREEWGLIQLEIFR